MRRLLPAKLLLYVILILLCLPAQAQQQDSPLPKEDESYKPLMLKMSEDGKKYARFIIWNQVWVEGRKNSQGDFRFNPSIRRSRILMHAQLSSRFMVLTHIGLNNLNANNLTATGTESNSPQIFLHDAWAEYKVFDRLLHVGGGLHYWNGLMRLSSASTLNFLMVDAPNPFIGWEQLGYTDQFGRHIGLYAKGKIGKVEYRLSANSALRNTLDAAKIPTSSTQFVYNTRNLYGEGKANLVWQGYAAYNFLDEESNLLPFYTGSYLGTKRVLNVGAGFFYHADGTIALKNADSPLVGNAGKYTAEELDSKTKTHDVNHWAVDVFYDAPLGSGALTAYGVYAQYDYGKNFTGVRASTGQTLFGQVGYLLPKFSGKGRLQPYAAAAWKDYDAFEQSGKQFYMGANWLINGHHAKISLEYVNTQPEHNGVKPEAQHVVRMQAHVFL